MPDPQRDLTGPGCLTNGQIVALRALTGVVRHKQLATASAGAIPGLCILAICGRLASRGFQPGSSVFGHQPPRGIASVLRYLEEDPGSHEHES